MTEEMNGLKKLLDLYYLSGSFPSISVWGAVQNLKIWMYDHLRANVLKNEGKKRKSWKSEKITQNYFFATLDFHNPRPLIFMFFYVFFRNCTTWKLIDRFSNIWYHNVQITVYFLYNIPKTIRGWGKWPKNCVNLNFWGDFSFFSTKS